MPHPTPLGIRLIYLGCLGEAKKLKKICLTGKQNHENVELSFYFAEMEEFQVFVETAKTFTVIQIHYFGLGCE